MKKITSIIFLFSLLICSISFVSCTKKIGDRVDNELKGTWKMINIADIDSKEFTEWVFTDDAYYKIYTDSNGVETTLLAGEYKVKVKFVSRKFISFTNCGEYYNGEWFIDELSSKYLIVYRNYPGIEYFEFIKQ